MRGTGWIIGIVVFVLLVLVLLGGFAMMGFGGFGTGYGMMGGYGMMRGAYSPLGWGLTLIFWALVIAGIVLLGLWLVRNLASGTTAALPRHDERPLDILKARYARGEITKEQFEEMRQDVEA
ncbi:MAG: SHOCT domain-containing protein [Rudaea sp.]